MAHYHRIWGLFVQNIINATSGELEDPEISPNVSITGAWVEITCQHHSVHTIMAFNGSDLG